MAEINMSNVVEVGEEPAEEAEEGYLITVP